MEVIRVRSTGPLVGELVVEGAKNSALKLMAASLLIPGTTRLSNVPNIADVHVMTEALEALGVQIAHTGDHELSLDATSIVSHEAPYDVVSRMRASTAVLGPLVARHGEAQVALPGGCNIGSRKIDMHLEGLRALGAHIEIDHGNINASIPSGRLRGAEVTLDFPSVGATENLIMAATLADGTTVIGNAAREPEIGDLIDFLVSAGAIIRGRGTSHIEVDGVEVLRPASHRVVGDRIEAGTYIVGAAMAGGPLTVRGFNPEHLGVFLDKLESAGISIERHADGVTVDRTGPVLAVDIQTLPYPGFPTDMQAQFMALMTLAEGSSIISENVFENRFMFADEIGRMGADIRIEGHHALVRGGTPLSGAPVFATDLRGGAALALAGLVAAGETEIADVYHIDRGYERFCEKLRSVGATVDRGPRL